MVATDNLAFFRAWLSDPLRVASVVPSSPQLAKMMVRQIQPSAGPVLELGPGTGVFTRALVDAGIRGDQLTLVELGSEFLPMLALRFPEAKILQMDAAKLSELPAPGVPFGAAVSGLPLLSMPAQKVSNILKGVFGLLQPGASLYQFTYGWRCPVPKDVVRDLGLTSRKVGTTFANFPPASVYELTRTRSG